MTEASTTPRLDADELAALEEERDFLLRSIEDLEREHDAGDIDDADFAALSDDYTARTAEVLRAIRDQRAAFADARRRMSTGRRLLVVVGVLAVGVLAGVLVAQQSGRRQANDTITGAGVVPQTSAQKAQACISLTSAARMSEAIQCYQKILDTDPKDATTLAYLGWTLVITSQSLTGDTKADALRAGGGFIDKAIVADPDLPDAYAFAAIVAFRAGDLETAKERLDQLDALDPPAQIKALTTTLRTQVEQGLRTPTTTTTVPAAAPTTTTVP